MNFSLWLESDTLKGYGGPAFKWQDYLQDYNQNQFYRYKQLYHDVQLELDNLAPKLKSVWKVNPKDLVWFSDNLNPNQYTSGMTVESTWTEDYQLGIKYFDDLVNWLNDREKEPVDPEDLKTYDKSKMRSIYDMLGDFEWNTLGFDDWDRWGPHEWYADAGEWSRCRDITRDHQRYPVTVLTNGSMIDGAHRLAVAIFNNERSYPCLVGVPEFWLNKLNK